MKKHGFTLAEILVTLGIIGVVAALVMPTFVQSTQNAKVGPRLAKAVAMFEQANQAILSDEEADSLAGAGVISNTTNYFATLAEHLKGAATDVAVPADGQTGDPTIAGFVMPDGTAIVIPEGEGDLFTNAVGEFAHQRRVSNCVMIDINGSAGPNRPARDRFYFYMMDDGSLQPYGGAQENERDRWTRRCAKNSTPAGDDRRYCTGHVLENGLKVEYK